MENTMIERAVVEKKVAEILKDKMGLDRELNPEDNMANDLGMDSLDHVEITMAIEDEFDIEIPDADADRIKTVKDISDYVCLKVI
jgi:acyl carrier protein